MYWGHHYWGMHAFWWIFWIAVMIAILYWPRPIAPRGRDTAIEALRRSYATGSITEEEYRHRMEVLTGQTSRGRVEESSQGGAGPATHASHG